MATRNQIDLTLSGQTGTGTFVGATAPTISQPVMNGVIDASAAAAGVIGEIISSSVDSPGTGLTTGVGLNVTTITLTAGDWNVWGQVAFAAANTTTVTQIGASVSAVSGGFDSPTSNAVSIQILNGLNWVSAGTTTGYLTTGVASISVSTNTTFYLSCFAAFTVSTVAAYGKIQARRVR